MTRIGIALPGGTWKGAWQFGALEALWKLLPTEPFLVSGTSIGGFNALFAVQGSWAEGKAWWTERGFPLRRALRPAFSRRWPFVGLSFAPLQAEIDRAHKPVPPGTSLSVNFVDGSTATNWTATYLSPWGKGAANGFAFHSIAPAWSQMPRYIGMSMRIQGVYDPAVPPFKSPKWFVDGGTLMNLNLSPLITAGCDTIFAILTSPLTTRTRPYPRTVRAQIMDALDQQGVQEVRQSIEQVALVNRYAVGQPRPNGGVFKHIDLRVIAPEAPVASQGFRWSAKRASQDVEAGAAAVSTLVV